MFEKDRWQEIFFALKQNKLRTILTAFGISWGIFMLMIMLGAGKGLENGIYKNMGDFATNSCFVWAETTTMPYKGFNKGRNYNFELKDMDLLKRKIEGIEYISPRLHNGTTPVSRNNKVEAYNIFGDFPEYNFIDPMTIVQGRFINHKDIDESRKVIVIGRRSYEMLFENGEDAIGQYLKINGVFFQVIGVFHSKHTGGWGDYQNQAIIMPLTAMQKTFNRGNTVGWFSITGEADYSVTDIEAKAMALLKAAHSVHPDDEMAIGHQNVAEDFKQMNGLFKGINLIIWIVGIGTLLAGIIGVSNIMLVVVRERTQEIGIQRAMGATPWNIISQFLLEASFLTILAGYIGLYLGIFLVNVVNKVIANQDIEAFYNPDVSLKVAFSALIILVISGIIAGIIPARKAVSMKPIDAIRSEYK